MISTSRSGREPADVEDDGEAAGVADVQVIQRLHPGALDVVVVPHRLLGAAPVDDVIARVARDAPLERRPQADVHGGGMLRHGGEGSGREDHTRLTGGLSRHRPSELGERAVELQLVDRIGSSRGRWQPESEEDEPAAEALLELRRSHRGRPGSVPGWRRGVRGPCDRAAGRRLLPRGAPRADRLRCPLPPRSSRPP